MLKTGSLLQGSCIYFHIHLFNDMADNSDKNEMRILIIAKWPGLLKFRCSMMKS